MNSQSASSICVVIPTYRRPQPLGWTLTSVLKQRLDGVSVSRARIVVINNDTDRAPVDEVVARVSATIGLRQWEIQVVHRDPPLPPVDSWYEGIRRHTSEGDIVFLNGDDDVLLPGSLAARLQMMQAHPTADILITAARTGFYYDRAPSERETRVRMEAGILAPAASSPAWVMTTPDVERISAIFISNHTYRNTPAFWACYEQSRRTMEILPGQGSERLVMIPEFLPVPLIVEGKAIASTMEACVRGQFASDVVNAGKGSISWVQPGYCYATCLYLYRRSALSSLPGMDVMRDRYWKLLLHWMLLSRGDPVFENMWQVLGGARVNLLPPRAWAPAARGAMIWLKGKLGVNARSLRKRMASERGVTYDEAFAAY